MTNPTPPEPRQPILGFDELVGVIIAFGTIGTILLASILGSESERIVPTVSEDAEFLSPSLTEDADKALDKPEERSI
jgi:hypothetical protein